jgi:hypothetical protein
VRKLLTLATTFVIIGSSVILSSCGGGGGGNSVPSANETTNSANETTNSTINSNSDSDTGTATAPTYKVDTINGTIYESKASSLSDIAYVSAIYWDKQWNGTLDVPVREMTVKVENGTFSLPVEDGRKYALFFFNATGQPVGFVGDSDTPYVSNVSSNKTVNIHVADSDGDGIIEADVEGLEPDITDDSFAQDGDADGIPDAVDPDWLKEKFRKIKFLPVTTLREQGLLEDNRPENDELSDFHYYYYFMHGNVNPYVLWDESGKTTIAIYNLDNGDGTSTSYLWTSSETGLLGSGYVTVPVFEFHLQRILLPIFVSPANLTFEELLTFKENIKTAIEEWNEAIQEGYEGAGIVYLGVLPRIEDTIWITTNHSTEGTYEYAPIKGAGMFAKASLSGNTVGETESASIMEYLSDSFTITGILPDGTEQVMKYWLAAGIGSVSIFVEDVNNLHTIEHELGHYIGLDHPFAAGLGDLPSVMNYSGYNRTEYISDFDKWLVADVFSKYATYGVDISELKNFYIDYANTHQVDIIPEQH